ncbi:GlxA family transcriptional regulator [Frigidibacter sp. MR17.24]|uniref:GlxA family transcriptional regulator n=1 Tax=Frigidibacter sp. MR17.24 TaxID=3127345 RepID=UPI0030130DB4
MTDHAKRTAIFPAITAATASGAVPAASGPAVFAPASGPLEIAVLVMPQASLLTLGSVIDPLRAANRHLGARAFRWRIVSATGAAVPLTCGIDLPAEAGLAGLAPVPDLLMVLAGYGAREQATAGVARSLRRAARGVRMIGAIDSGGWLLAAAGLLGGARVTTHWEDLEDFAAAHPDTEVVPDRHVVAGRVASAGGAGPAQDLMLELIAARYGVTLAMQVAGTFITSRRAGAESQLTAIAAGRPEGGDPRVTAAIARMETRLDAPESAGETAAAVGLSLRRLQSLFRDQIGVGPAEYGAELRLQAARRLVTDSRHPLAEVALRTGFGSLSAFSRAFRARFGLPPGRLRRQPRG